jgi:hypothetical protein
MPYQKPTYRAPLSRPQTFKANPFFEDEKLSKTFRFSEDGLVTVTGTKPRWKDGMVSQCPQDPPLLVCRTCNIEPIVTTLGKQLIVQSALASQIMVRRDGILHCDLARLVCPESRAVLAV